ncbi:Hypothetical protein NTJ_09564 [Nesidiocoris tenuis]|uniref:Gustatory receptor n=1 Tax=Nesidiocoris tenuis TaxID=355587 RepID=A0ABN7B0R8_9HEMI|nr:Hypothetical protein NTJ_09564 [Nesidiocoris tenuis]
MSLFSPPVTNTLEFLSIFGAVPFQWNKGKLVLRLRYSLALISLTILLLVECFYENYAHSNRIYFGLQLFISLFAIFMPATSLAIFVRTKVQLETSLNSLVKLHFALGLEPIRVGLLAEIMFAILTVLTGLCSVWVLHYGSVIFKISNAVAWSGFILYRVTLSMIFCFFVRIPGQCLDAMSLLLQRTQKSQIPIEKLVNVYNKLVDDCDDLNSSFEVQLLLNLAYSLSQVILNLYTMDASNLLSFLAGVGSALMASLLTWYLFVCSESVVSKAKLFNKILSNVALKSNGRSENNIRTSSGDLFGLWN